MPPDVTLFGCDLIYARYLKRNNQIWWASEERRPDLGGKCPDDVRLMADDEDEVFELNTRGCYATVSARLDIDYAAVNAVLQQTHIYEGEGTQASIAFDQTSAASAARFDEQLSMRSGGDDASAAAAKRDKPSGESGAAAAVAAMLTHLDEAAQCRPAFRVLRTMLHDTVRCATERRSKQADRVLIDFYRWLRSNEALLYDPALHRLLQSLQRKQLLQLLGEYRRLGCSIVFASCQALVVSTPRQRQLDEALQFLEYVAAAVKQKEQFAYLEITARASWAYLLWYDESNYAGMTFDESAPTTALDDDAEELAVDSDVESIDGERSVLSASDDDDVVGDVGDAIKRPGKSRPRKRKLLDAADDADNSARRAADLEQIATEQVRLPRL